MSVRSVWLATLIGCGGGISVKGDADGDPIPLKAGYFARDNEFFDNEDAVILVSLSSIEEPCAKEADLNEAIEESDDNGDLEDAWQDQLPEDFWTVQLYLRVGDLEDELDGTVFDGVAWDETVEDEEEVVGFVTHYTDHLDEDFFSGNFSDLGDYLDEWYTDGGDLEIKGYKADESLRGTFVTELAETDDGDSVGEVTFEFSVERCSEMEQYLF